MSVKSHTQLNKGIMERFSFKANDPSSGKYQSKVDMVYYLDIKNKKIGKEKVSKLGVIFDYFSEKTEEVLSIIESKFCTIIDELSNYKSTDTYDFSKNEKFIKAFLCLIISRSKTMVETVVAKAKREDSKYVDVIFNNNTVALAGFNSYLLNPNNYTFFNNYDITLLCNESNYNFVIAKSGFYFYNDEENDIDWILFPISPKRAILLFNKTSKFNFRAPEGDIVSLATSFDHHIKNLNLKALEMEMHQDNEFILSKTKSELIDILEVLQSMKV